MRFSRNVEQACDVLESVVELKSDLLLVHFLRGQRLIERINQGLDFDPGMAQDDALSPTLLFVRAFEQEVRRARNDWPADIQDNGTPTKVESACNRALADVW